VSKISTFREADFQNQTSSSERIIEFTIPDNTIDKFLASVDKIDVEELNFIPFKRYICAKHFCDSQENDDLDRIVKTVSDYDTGCAAINSRSNLNSAQYIKISTAISHLLSQPISEPSGNYYGLTTVQHDDNPALKILDPYQTFALHTDGVFMDNPVDWLMMMKTGEEHAVGGNSRLLHIADFTKFEEFKNEPHGSTIFDFGLEQYDKRFEIFSRVSNMTKGRSRLLDQVQGQRRVKFVDQFVLPRTIEQADYIDRLQKSMESSAAVTEFPLPIGTMIVLNNNVWLHGRAPFERNPQLRRTLLRQYGCFPNQHPYGF